MISAQCPECHSGVNSNKRCCGTPAQAQASARVDVPTARVFPAWTMESYMSASFCVNAWICAPQATDRDPQSFNVNAWICARRATDRDLERVSTRMLGYAHNRQPTVILRRKSECLDMCTATMNLHSMKICNICNVCNFHADLLFWN